MITVKNPFSGEVVAEVPYATKREIAFALERAAAAFKVWKNSRAYERSELLTRVANLISKGRKEYIDLLCREAGKPVRFAEMEFDRSVHSIRWGAAEAGRFNGEMLRPDVENFGRLGFGINSRMPRGPVLGVVPFNWPLLCPLHKVVPAVAVGAPCILKPSIFTPITSLRIAEAFRECGAPEGLVQCVVANDEDSANLTRAPEIAFISFTGSTRVGNIIRTQAPEKPQCMELGGNGWVGILPDVNPELFPAITRRLVATGYGQSGQGCLSVQNVAVWHKQGQEFITMLRKAVEDIPYGDTTSPDVVSGPSINVAAATRIRAAIDEASKSWEVVRSKNPVGKPASECEVQVIPPALLLQKTLPVDDAIVTEELFGPVMNVLTFEGVDQFLNQVNSSRYGLQTGIFTDHWPTIQHLYRELQTGALNVNDTTALKYDHAPFGGVKDSGSGREGIRAAMDDMTEGKFLAIGSAVPFAAPETALRRPPAYAE